MKIVDGMGCKGKTKIPTIEERICPVCGEEIEVFVRVGRIDEDAKCDKCGYILKADEPYRYKTRFEIENEKKSEE